MTGAPRQRWRKLGPVIGVDRRPIKLALVPTPQKLDDDRIRLLYGDLGPDNISRAVAVDIDLGDPTHALSGPYGVLDIGPRGRFDDHGVVPIQVAMIRGSTHLYYAGFQLSRSIPYTIFAGAAVSHDGGLTYARRATPVMPPSDAEPHIRTACFVIQTESGFRAWYIAGTGWVARGDKQLPTYDMRVATADDPDDWPASGQTVMTPRPGEIGFGRPWVVVESGVHRMWYSVRRLEGYSLGYAESEDGLTWHRLDEALDMGSPIPGFDDEMECYAAIVPHGAQRLMFYGGNGYGRAGIGVAISQDWTGRGPSDDI